MKYLKTHENWGDSFVCHKKYKLGNFVYITGNNEPAEIIDIDYDDPYQHYRCKFPDSRKIWYNEKYLIRKLEPWEIEAFKYNL
jgi:hypothetical protein